MAINLPRSTFRLGGDSRSSRLMDSSRPTVFVADDNLVLLQGLDRALSANGYSVRTATDGRAVMELMESAPEPPDLLLLDVMMPEMTGLDVLHTVHGDGRWADLPVVLITAKHDVTLPAAAIRGGAVDFLAKPFRLGELMARVEAHVHRHRELRRAREEARVRTEVVQIVRDLNAAVSAEDVFQLVGARLPEVLGGSRGVVAVFERGEENGQVATISGVPADETPEEVRCPRALRGALAERAAARADGAGIAPLFGEDAGELSEGVLVSFPVTSGATGVLAVASGPGAPPLHEDATALMEQVAEGIVQVLGRVQVFENLVAQRRHLHDLAHTDELTGCATRRSLLRSLAEELELARRRDAPLTLVMVDLDAFKEVNDRFGHLAGDAALREVGGWLRGEEALRAGDRVVRYGGDEFLVILPGTGPEGGLRFVERLQAHLAATPLTFPGAAAVRLGASAGVASWPAIPAETPEALIAAADAALYRAKGEGKGKPRPVLPARLPVERIAG